MKYIAFLSLVTLAISSLISPGASAAKPVPTVEKVGYDVSYPQCGRRLPTDHYFAIVGVNGGKPTTTNPCLSAQLAWANMAKTGSTQARVQLYVNTANPGEVIDQITTWPTSNVDSFGVATANPYGSCDGLNDAACSWQYGWNRAGETAVNRFAPAASAAGIASDIGSYVWWLDVELGNTWQTAELANNTATLEGMTAYFGSKGAQVGLYSTAAQWAEIVGTTVGQGSNLNGLPNWRPSGSTLSNATSNCSVAPLTTGGTIALTQYVVKNLDHNHSCS